MKRTYTCTTFHPDLRTAKFELKLYKESKYSDLEPMDRIQYTGVTAWDIIAGGEEAEEIEAQYGLEGIDARHSYLVLHFEDGSTATFKNTRVEMFIW